MRGGLVWSHLLASILGGLILAGVLLGFGVIGKQKTEKVPIDYSLAPPAASGGASGGSNLEQIYGAESPGVVLIRSAITRSVSSPFIAGVEKAGSTATGSGFLISHQGTRGLILTTFHVIDGTDSARPRITVAFNSDTSRQAVVVEEDPANDEALLKVDLRGVPAQVQPLRLGDSHTVAAGANVLSIANPFGLERTLTSGIVSALQPRLSGAGGAEIDDVIQTDMAPNPGADGGPLLDNVGDVIGINSQIEVSSGGSSYPVGFAVPIDTARTIILKGVLP